jgi:hypothetical protein
MNVEMTKKERQSPGGNTHHHAFRIAPALKAKFNICPQLRIWGSPKPRKLNEASNMTPAETPIAM